MSVSATPAAIKIRAWVACTFGLAVAGPIHGEQPPATPVQVTIAPFEIWGNATAEIADAISTNLMSLLEDDACFEVLSRTDPAVAYVVEGSIHAEPKRPVAALQIADRKTGRVVWSDNYDYTNITGDMMAQDVFRTLRSGTLCAPE